MRSDAEFSAQKLLNNLFFKRGLAKDCAEVAELADMKMGTATRHWSSLIKQGQIERGYRVASGHEPLKIRAMVSIVTIQAELPAGQEIQQDFARYLKTDFMLGAGRSFAETVRIEDAFVIMGDFGNIGLILRVADDEALGAFVTQVVLRLPGVGNTNTVRLIEA